MYRLGEPRLVLAYSLNQEPVSAVGRVVEGVARLLVELGANIVLFKSRGIRGFKTDSNLELYDIVYQSVIYHYIKR